MVLGLRPETWANRRICKEFAELSHCPRLCCWPGQKCWHALIAVWYLIWFFKKVLHWYSVSVTRGRPSVSITSQLLMSFLTTDPKRDLRPLFAHITTGRGRLDARNNFPWDGGKVHFWLYSSFEKHHGVLAAEGFESITVHLFYLGILSEGVFCSLTSKVACYQRPHSGKCRWT